MGSRILLLLLAACGATERPRAEPIEPRVERVTLAVSDLEAETRFFVGVLGFRNDGAFVERDAELDDLLAMDVSEVRGVNLSLGTERVALATYGTGRPFPPDSRSNDRWFQHLAIVVSDIDEAWRRVSAAGAVPISRGGPQTIPLSNPAAGGIRAMYFRDPEGHPLELIWYPPGKGQERWQARDRLFLGIDHTAIAAGDTDASLRFYGEVLGLEVAGESLNRGREQEQLSGVERAEVRITGLRGSGGPGVELLEYLAPRDGRPSPTDTAIADRWSTAITLSADVDRAVELADTLGGDVVSERTVSIDGRRELLLRDPDGHALRLVQP
jgi:catechol 2,3-dioxygenase-like lactoylglutathione lyase family enzyme